MGVISSSKPTFDLNVDVINTENRISKPNIDFHKSHTARFEPRYLLSAGVFERGRTTGKMNGDKTTFGILELWKRATKRVCGGTTSQPSEQLKARRAPETHVL